MTVTIEQQIACVKREIAMRDFVYPRRVADGKMKPAKAHEEAEAMRAVLATLERVAASDRLL